MEPDEISSRTDFAAALTEARERAGLTIRELARRLNTPPGTLGDYFGGRHVPSAAQLPLLGAALGECGITDPNEVQAWFAAVRRVRAASDRRVSRLPVPYRGLKPFEPEDADLYFGRAPQVQEILQLLVRLRRDAGPSNGVATVVGPSGSGKSSLLRAGVVAAIRSGALDGPEEKWTCSVTTPGTDPAAALTEAMGTPDRIPRVVVIDQFEETFTSVSDVSERARFFAGLTDRSPDTLIVIGLRADFYADAAREPLLLAALQHAQIVVGPMRADDLRDAIVRPAERVGISVEDGLVDVILADLAPHDAAGPAHDAGALPLMSHALLATCERSSGRRLTIADYRSTGGIEGAIQRTAEDVFTGLTPEEQDTARRIFVRLVNIDDEVAVTRRRVAGDELDQLTSGENDTAPQVVARFVERRLLTTHASSVEVSHEALLSAWPRLKGWIDADRAGLRLHRLITEGANSWQQSARDDALLLRGGRLDAATEWATEPDHSTELNQLERDYIDAAVRYATAERERERRRTQRLRGLLAAVAALAIVASALAAFSMRARNDADHERQVASAARDDALSRQVAIQSRQLMQSDPGLAQQLALVSYDIAHTTEARSAAIDASTTPTITRILGAQGPTSLALSPDGRLLAVSHADDGSVHLYRAARPATRSAVGVVPAPAIKSQIFAMAFTPNSDILVTGGDDARVHLWSAANPAHPSAVATLNPRFTGAVQSIAVSPDGRRLVAGGTGPRPIVEWDISTPATPTQLTPPRGVPAEATVQSVTFSRDGSQLAAAGTGGLLMTWPSATSATARPRVARGGTATNNAVRFDPTGSLLFSGDVRGVTTVRRADSPTLATVRTLPGGAGFVNVLAVSGDDRQLAVGSSDNTVTQWDTRTWTKMAVTPHRGPVTGLAYTSGSRTLMSTAADGTLRAWPASGPAIPLAAPAYNLAYSADGARLAIGYQGDHPASRVWATRDPTRPAPAGPALPMPEGSQPADGAVAINPTGELVAEGNRDGQVQLWDTRVPREPQRAGPAFPGGGALIESLVFSPDGSLLAVGSDDKDVHLWDVRDTAHPKRIASMRTSGFVFNVAFSPRGHRLAAADADATAHLWDVSRPARPRAIANLGGFKSYVYAVAFSADGATLAAASSDHTTRLWNVAAPGGPTLLGRPLTGPLDYIYGAAFSHDGRLLAVASNDHTVWLYDVRDRGNVRSVATLRALDGNVFAVAFSPDDRTLTAVGRSPSVPMWTVDPADYRRRLCASAGDPITRQEWAQYVPGAAYRPPCGS